MKTDASLNQVTNFGSAFMACGTQRDQNDSIEGFVIFFDPYQTTSQATVHYLPGVNPKSIQASSDTSIHLYGNFYDSISGSWDRNGFFGQIQENSGWVEFVEVFGQQEFMIKDGVFLENNNLIIISGEVLQAGTQKKDLALMSFSPAQKDSVSMSFLGFENFEHLEGMELLNGEIFLYGSTENLGNGIDHPFIAKFDQFQNLKSFEVMAPQFRGSVTSMTRNKEGMIFSFGFQRNTFGEYQSFMSSSSGIGEKLLCNSSLLVPALQQTFLKIKYGLRKDLISKQIRALNLVKSQSEKLISRNLYCEDDPCPDSIYVSGIDPFSCLGVSSLAKTEPKLIGDWYLNNIFIGRDSIMPIQPNTTGKNSVEFVFQNNNCQRIRTLDFVVLDTPEVNFTGPAWVCPGDSLIQYEVILGNFNEDSLVPSIQGGSIIFMTKLPSESKHILNVNWFDKAGEIGLSVINKENCLSNVQPISVSVDSFLNPEPEIVFVSWGDPSLKNQDTVFIGTVNNWYYSITESRLWLRNDPSLQFSTELKENEMYSFKIDQKRHPLLNSFIEYKDHCRIKKESDRHRTIMFQKEEIMGFGSSKFEEYQGTSLELQYDQVEISELDPKKERIQLEGLQSQRVFVNEDDKKMVWIEARDLNGDLFSRSNYLEFEGESDLIISNVVTPNEDGINDKLGIKGYSNIPELYWQIFNRYGDLLMEFEGDPRFQNFNDLNSGAYFYTVQAGGEKSYKGWFQVIR